LFEYGSVVNETESSFVCETRMDYLFLKGLVIEANKFVAHNGYERSYTIMNLIGKEG
jgi:hypothetical protein